MFCAMATVIDRCKTEGVVDVFQVVKALRAQKPGAVPTVVTLSKNCITLLAHTLCHNYRTIIRQCLKSHSIFWTPLIPMPTFKICRLCDCLYYHVSLFSSCIHTVDV